METLQAQAELLSFFKALSDVERLKIIGLLALEARKVEQVSALLGVKPTTVLRQLEYLRTVGLVKEEQGSYQLDARALEAMSRRLLSGLKPEVKPEEFEGDEYERKVVHDYLSPDGSLKSIPSQRKKLVAVLRYILRDFEAGKQYPEKEVNVLLRRYHSDVASLRRYLVDEGLLQREKGVYWRSTSDKPL